jgi:hypothetical protein
MPHRHHQPRGHRDHPYPQERATLERGLPSGDCEKSKPARHPALRPGILEALDRNDDRSRIETKMRCLNAFGERIAPRHPDSQTADIQIRVAHINRFNALGTAEIVRVA